MKLLDILPKKSIIPDLKGRTKKQVLEELIDALLNERPELDRERLRAVLLERERLGSHWQLETGLLFLMETERPQSTTNSF